MQINAVAADAEKVQLEMIKKASAGRVVTQEYVEDPIREFARSSTRVGTVRNWLTLPVEERKRIIREDFGFMPRQEGEDEAKFQNRLLDRWRSLCVIIQEESRAPSNVRNVDVAIGALKLLFHEVDWKKWSPGAAR